MVARPRRLEGERLEGELVRVVGDGLGGAARERPGGTAARTQGRRGEQRTARGRGVHGYFFPLVRAARRSSARFRMSSTAGFISGGRLPGHLLHLGDAGPELFGVGLRRDLLQVLLHHGRWASGRAASSGSSAAAARAFLAEEHAHRPVLPGQVLAGHALEVGAR